MTREDLKSALEENGITQAEFARRTGTDRSYINKYLKGAEVTEEVFKKMCDGYQKLCSGGTAALSERKEEEAYTGGMLMTEDAQGVMAVCQIAQTMPDYGLIIGRSGYGKSYALKYYAQSKRVVYIECNVLMSARDLLDEVESALSLPRFGGTAFARAKKIQEFLTINPGYLIIFDEADKLMTKYSHHKLEVIRAIANDDRPGTKPIAGVILAGEPALKGEIQQHIERLKGRCGTYYELRGIREGEVRRYISGRDFDEAATLEMVKRATNPKRGSFRILSKTLSNISRVSGGRNVKINMDIVRQASQMMLI